MKKFLLILLTVLVIPAHADDVAVSSGGGPAGALTSWVVIGKDIYFCNAGPYISDRKEEVVCMKAKKYKQVKKEEVTKSSNYKKLFPNLIPEPNSKDKDIKHDCNIFAPKEEYESCLQDEKKQDKDSDKD